MKSVFFIFCFLVLSISCNRSHSRDVKKETNHLEAAITSKDTVQKTMVEAILDHYQYTYTHRRPDVENDSCFYFNIYLSFNDSCYYAIVTGNDFGQYFSVEYERKTNRYGISPSFIGYALLGNYYVAMDWENRKEGLPIPTFLKGIQYINAERYVERFVSSSFFGSNYDPYCCKYKIVDNSYTFVEGGYW